MPKSSIDAVTVNTKETSVKLVMANLTAEEQDVLVALLRRIAREVQLTRLLTLRWLLEQYDKHPKQKEG